MQSGPWSVTRGPQRPPSRPAQSRPSATAVPIPDVAHATRAYSPARPGPSDSNHSDAPGSRPMLARISARGKARPGPGDWDASKRLGAGRGGEDTGSGDHIPHKTSLVNWPPTRHTHRVDAKASPSGAGGTIPVPAVSASAAAAPVHWAMAGLPARPASGLPAELIPSRRRHFGCSTLTAAAAAAASRTSPYPGLRGPAAGRHSIPGLGCGYEEGRTGREAACCCEQ